jgi:acetyl esterase/lipase
MSPAACRRIVFYVHGGGFVKGDLAAFHHGCSTFSREFHALVAFPLYPLCPEHPLEQAVREIHASYCRVRREFPSAELVLMADSAGGLLAALLLRSMHKHGLPMPRALVLLSPLLEIHDTSASGARTGVRDPVLDAELLDWLCSLARQNADPAGTRLDWNALGYFPPTYLVASDSELLRDDSKRLEAALRAQCVPVTSAYWPGQPHAFPLLHRFLPEARAATDGIRTWLDNLCAGP